MNMTNANVEGFFQTKSLPNIYRQQDKSKNDRPYKLRTCKRPLEIKKPPEGGFIVIA